MPRRPLVFHACLTTLTTLACLAAPLTAWAQGAALAPVRTGDRVVVRYVLPPDGRTTALPDPSAVMTVPVDERGMAHLPLVGPLPLGGVPAAAALDSVRAHYARFVRPGGVLLSLERRIPVLGDVRRPELYYLDLTVRLRDAVTMAGGASETGKPRELLLLRNGEVRRITNWQSTPVGEMELLSGDEIVVPRQPWLQRYALALVSLLGAVGTLVLSVQPR